MSEDRLPGTGSEQSGFTRRSSSSAAAVGAVGPGKHRSIPALAGRLRQLLELEQLLGEPYALATALPSGGLSALETAAKAR